MIRWCAYCQRFLGEVEPYQDMNITHGMCASCAKVGLEFSAEIEKRIYFLSRLQTQLRDLQFSHDIELGKRLVDEGLSQGVRAIDLLLGIVTPLLKKFDASTDGLAIKNIEKNLAAICEYIATKANLSWPQSLNEATPDILFAAPPSNQHLFYLKVLELWLRDEGLFALSLNESMTNEKMQTACEKYQPKVVGLIMSVNTEAEEINQLAQTARETLRAAPPVIFVSGTAVRNRLVSEKDLPGLSLIYDEPQLFLIIKANLALGFFYDLKRNANKPKRNHDDQ
ncbi:MAG: hypothetical protein H7061_14430 [Bdellovibrionaceae bacterium]|nr:hypothetical protein [Bdellovibrio sp.]